MTNVLVINLSARLPETGWYGRALAVTATPRKLALTCTDTDATGRIVTAEGGVQVPPPTDFAMSRTPFTVSWDIVHGWGWGW